MVPPGEVTAAAQRRGAGVALDEQPGRAEQRLERERLGDVARQAREHAGLDQRLGDEEDVGGAGARQAGDGVERRLRHAHDGADGAEDLLGPREVLLAGRASPALMAAAPAPTSAGVLGIARTTGSLPSDGGLDRRAS